MVTFSVVSAHFGDPVWIKQLVKRLLAQSQADRILEIVVIDQDRNNVLGEMFGNLAFEKAKVVSFEEDPEAIALMAHDHGPSLNSAMGLRFTGSHILVLDSDMVLCEPDFLSVLGAELERWDCVMARDTHRKGLSHPCLMAFPALLAPSLDFTEGMREVQLDTGRLAALQARRHDFSVRLLEPQSAFGGLAGKSFLSGKVFHVEQGSFPSSENPRIRKKVTKLDRHVREAVLEEPPRLRFTRSQILLEIAPRIAFSRLNRLKVALRIKIERRCRK